MTLGLTSEAVSDFDGAVAIDPTQDAYGLALGLAALASGAAERSRAAYAAVVAHDPVSVDGNAGLGIAAAALGDCAAATSALERARDLARRQGRAFDDTFAADLPVVRAALARCPR
jgi:tetratricopeptide (TPR) repeat protein